jgi:glycosyltransferase involved in cell wall biosynthesis
MSYLCIAPCWNEEKRLPELLKSIKEFQLKNTKVDFLFFDNGSTDQSLQIIQDFDIPVIKYEKNMGAGYALIHGLKIGIEKNYFGMIHLAANGKMMPNEINKFIDKIENENFDFVHGSRFLNGGDFKTNPILRIFLIKLTTLFLSFIYNRKITDDTCGFRAYKVNLLKNNLNLIDKKKFYTYAYEYYVLGKILKNKKVKFSEVPITMLYPKKGRYSKIRPVLDWYVIIAAYIEALIDGKSLNE